MREAESVESSRRASDSSESDLRRSGDGGDNDDEGDWSELELRDNSRDQAARQPAEQPTATIRSDQDVHALDDAGPARCEARLVLKQAAEKLLAFLAAVVRLEDRGKGLVDLSWVDSWHRRSGRHGGKEGRGR